MGLIIVLAETSLQERHSLQLRFGQQQALPPAEAKPRGQEEDAAPHPHWEEGRAVQSPTAVITPTGSGDKHDKIQKLGARQKGKENQLAPSRSLVERPLARRQGEGPQHLDEAGILVQHLWWALAGGTPSKLSA